MIGSYHPRLSSAPANNAREQAEHRIVHDSLLWNDPLGPAVAAVLAVTFLGWWRMDRARRYHLWWSIAFLAGLTANALVRVSGPGRVVDLAAPIMPLVTALGAYAPIAFMIGARHYRGGHTAAATGLLLALGALVWVLLQIVAQRFGTIVIDAFHILVLGAGAYCLWGAGSIERAIAGVVILRAINGNYLSLLLPAYSLLERLHVDQAIALTLGVMLLAASYLRARRELAAHRDATRDLVRARAPRRWSAARPISRWSIASWMPSCTVSRTTCGRRCVACSVSAT